MSEVYGIINVDVNTGKAIAELQRLQKQVNGLNRTLASMGPDSSAQMLRFNQQLIEGARASGMFNASIVPASRSIDQFTNKLEKNKFTLGEYTRYAASQIPGLRKTLDAEFTTMQRVAEDRVRKIATQYVALGEAGAKAQRAIALSPTGALNLKDANTQAAVAAQRHAILNKVLADGSTKMLNWGKNTQWAGRQLMVGFSIPLAMLGTTAAKTFKELDQASIAFKRVYGDLDTTTAEMERNLSATKALGKEYTKYGIAVKDTVDLAARAAATGATNESLTAATEQTLRLATLGQMEYNTALDATISMQTAFGISNQELAQSVDFLNAVENQTVLTLEDMALAIPRVAPVIKGLGGDVKDLAVFMTAMREGGVSAEQGANALKSGLASLINPTNRAQEALAKFNIDLNGIINRNRGDLMGVVTEFAEALSSLDEFSQQQSLEQIFGKYQYARMGALFKNIVSDSGQAARAMDLAGQSAEDLAALADKELSKISDATSTKFTAAFEQMKLALAPIGEQFMKVATPVIEGITKLLDKFNNLPDGIKNFAVIATAGLAGLGPIILMTIGLLANGMANITKGALALRSAFHRLRGSGKDVEYLAVAELEAATATAQLEGKTRTLTSALYLQKPAIISLITLYERLATAAATAAGVMPGSVGKIPGGKPSSPIKMASGGTVPGSGNKDTVPALLTPGESVITKEATQKYGPILEQMNAGTLPGYNQGVISARLAQTMRNVVGTKGRPLTSYASSPRKAPGPFQTVRNYFGSSVPENVILTAYSVGGGRGNLSGRKVARYARTAIAHVGKAEKVNGAKPWAADQTRLTTLAENEALQNLFSEGRSEEIYNIAKKSGILGSRTNKALIEKIIREGYHPTSRSEYKFTEQLLNSLFSNKNFVQSLKLQDLTDQFFILRGLVKLRTGNTNRNLAKIGDDPYGIWSGDAQTMEELIVGAMQKAGLPITAMPTPSNKVRVQARNSGGQIFDSTSTTRSTVPGVGSTDTVPAVLTPGEFVVNKNATRSNIDLLHAINDGKVSQSTMAFNKGGMIPGVQYFGANMLQRIVQPMKSAMTQGEIEILTAGNFERGFARRPIKTRDNVQNLHGVGVYTTNDSVIAQSYLTKGDANRHIYSTKISQSDAKRKFINLDASVTDEIAGSQMFKIEQQLETLVKRYGLNLDDILPRSGGIESKTMAEYREELAENAAKALMKKRGVDRTDKDGVLQAQYDAQMLFVDAATKSGYMGVSHRGGLLAGGGKRLHDVFILYQQPQSMRRVDTGAEVKMLNRGMVPGVGNKDTVPALLTPGEAVINKEATAKYGPILQQMNAGTLPGFEGGIVPGAQAHWTDPTITTDAEEIRSFLSKSESTDKTLNKVANALDHTPVRMTKYTNSVLNVPEPLNYQQMSGTSAQRLFSNPKYSERMLQPYFKAIEKELSKTMDKDQVKKEMVKVRKSATESLTRMATKFGDIGENIVKTPRFNAIVSEELGRAASSAGSAAQRAHEQVSTRTTRASFEAMNKQGQWVKIDQGNRVSVVGRGEAYSRGNVKGATPFREEDFGRSSQAGRAAASRPAPTRVMPAATEGMTRRQAAEYKRRMAAQGTRGLGGTSFIAGRNGILPPSLLQIEGSRTPLAIESGPSRFTEDVEARAARGSKGYAQSERSIRRAELEKLIKPMYGAKYKAKKYIGKPLNKFGSGVVKGAMPLSMAMGMGSMLPVMNADEQGKFMGIDSGTAMMGMMGGSAFLSLLPMLQSAAVPVAAVAAAATVVAAGLYIWRKNVDDASRESAKLGAAIGGTANALGTISKLFGQQTPSQRQAAAQLNFTSEEQEASYGQFQPYMESEAGQKFIKDLRDSTSSERLSKFGDYIRNAVASGLMDKETASLFTKTISTSLQDPVLGRAVLSMIAKQGDGTKEMLDIAKDRDAAIRSDALLNKILTSNGDESISYQDSSRMIGASLQATQDFANAAALAREEFTAGKISFGDYRSVVEETTARQKAYSDALQKSIENSSDFGGSMQALGDQLTLMGLDETQRTALLNLATPSREATLQYAQQQVAEKYGMSVDEMLALPSSKQVRYAAEVNAKKGDIARLAEERKSEFGGAAAEAVVQGLMSPAQAAEIASITAVSEKLYNTFKQVESVAGAGRGLLAAGFAQSTQANAPSGLAGKSLEAYTKIGVDIISEGYDLSAFQTFIEALPDTMRLSIVTDLQGADIETVEKYLVTAQRSMGAGMTANQAAKYQATDAYKAVLSASEGVDGDSTALEKWNQMQEKVAEKFKGAEADVVLRIALEQEPPDIVSAINKILDTVNFIEQNVPQEIRIAMGIDTGNAQQMKDLENSTQQIMALSEIIKVLPEDQKGVAARIAVSVVDGKNKPLTGDELIAETNKIAKAVKNLDSKNLNVEKQAILTVIQSFETPDGARITPEQSQEYLNDWVAKFGQKRVSAANEVDIQTVINLEQQVTGAEELLGSLKLALVAAQIGQNPAQVASIEQQIADTESAIAGYKAGIKSVFNTASNRPAKSGGSGGGAKENPLLDLKKSLVEQIKLYADMEATIKSLSSAKTSLVNLILKDQGIFDRLKSIKGGGLNTMAIERIMGMGADGARKWLKKYTVVGKSGRRTLTKEGRLQEGQIIGSRAAEILDNQRLERMQQAAQTRAVGGLRKRGTSKEVIDYIAQDPEKLIILDKLQQDVKNKVEGSEKAYKKFVDQQIRSVAEAKKLNAALDPTGMAIEALQKQQSLVDAQINKISAEETQKSDAAFLARYGMSKRETQILIDENQMKIDGYEQEIAKLEERNKVEQNAVNLLEHSKKVWQDKINLIQEEIDGYQKSIDAYQRENELRNQQASIINHSLDIMSVKEEQIQKAYDDRVKALDTIASINEHIINQQKNQIGLATALASGDIAAAAQARQDMQAADAQYAVDQMRQGLETGMQNQVAGLTTEDGLTRVQAEERLRQIKEQNYQNELLIVGLENKIYDATQRIIPNKEQIANIDKSIADYNESIWQRNNDIYQIQEKSILPLQQQNTEYGIRLKTSEDQLKIDISRKTLELESQKDVLDFGLKNLESIQAQEEATGYLATQWQNVANQIAEANKLLKDTSKTQNDIVNSPTATKAQKDAAKQALANAQKAYNDEINRIRTEMAKLATTTETKYAGGMIRYAAGGVAGVGGRDSVPAMLTPGEYVVRKASVAKYGTAMFDKINMGAFEMPRYNVSEPVSAGSVKSVTTKTNVNAPTYNTYSVSVNVPNTNASPDMIANKVLMRMAETDRMGIRSIRGN